MRELLCILTLLFTVASCVEKATVLEFEEQSGFGQVTTFGDPADTFDSNKVEFKTHYQRAMQILTKYQCMSCHGSGSGKAYGDFSRFSEEADWVNSGLVVGQKPDESLLIQELINYGASISNMPLGGQALAEADYLAMRTWVSSLTGLPPVASKPTAPEPTSPVPESKPQPQPQPTAPVGAIDDSLSAFDKAKAVLTKHKCMSCHSTGSGRPFGDFSSFTTEEEWVKSGLIVRQSPDESLLIQELMNFGANISNMPLGGQKLPDSEYQMLRSWIQGIAAPAPAPTPAPVPQETAEAEKDPVEKTNPEEVDRAPATSNPSGSISLKMNLSPLHQFVGQMEELYRAEGVQNRNLIFQKIYATVGDLWGAGCDYYKTAIDRIEGSDTVHYRHFATCDYHLSENLPTGSHSVVKAGARINLCERFLDDDGYIATFFQKNLGGSKSFSKANMKKAFHLYYPTLEYKDSIHNGFLQSLSDVGASGLSEDRKWRTYLTSLCQSLYWEIH